MISIAKNKLLQHKDSFFDAYMNSGNWHPGSDGTYFVDRTPSKYLDLIFDYVRTGRLDGSRLTVIQYYKHQVIINCKCN